MCESIFHVLWACSAYSSSRASFMGSLELLGDRYVHRFCINQCVSAR